MYICITDRVAKPRKCRGSRSNLVAILNAKAEIWTILHVYFRYCRPSLMYPVLRWPSVPTGLVDLKTVFVAFGISLPSSMKLRYALLVPTSGSWQPSLVCYSRRHCTAHIISSCSPTTKCQFSPGITVSTLYRIRDPSCSCLLRYMATILISGLDSQLYNIDVQFAIDAYICILEFISQCRDEIILCDFQHHPKIWFKPLEYRYVTLQLY